jgi:sporulation protein YlmC with PRC-barrel domain
MTPKSRSLLTWAVQMQLPSTALGSLARAAPLQIGFNQGGTIIMATPDNPSDTSGRLIAASKVSGTSVYDLNDNKLGSIYDVMLDKRSGTSQYAILSFGGFLGIGEKYHPLPWAALKYDERQGGYVVNLDRKQLEGAPAYDTSDTALWGDATWGARVDDYYGIPCHDDLRMGARAADPLRRGTIPPPL